MALQNTRNNAKGTLKVSVSSSAVTLILNTGEGALFPTSNFKVTLKDYVAGVLVSQEIVNISSRTGDTLTVLSRASEDCPRTATSLVQTSTAYDFNAYVDAENGTVVENNITSGLVSAISSDLDAKLTVADYISGAKLYDDSVTGTDAYQIFILDVASYAQVDGQSFRVKVDVSNTDTATLQINFLGAKNIRKYGGDPLLTGDIVGGQIIEVIWNNYANQFELSSVIDQSDAVVSSSLTRDFVLGETITSTNPVSLDTTGNIWKTVLDGTVVSDGLNTTGGGKQVVALSNTSFVTFAWNNVGSIQTIVGSISDNVITYGTVNSFTPTSWSSFAGTPYLVVLSSTTFVVAHGYVWSSGGNTEFLQATAYTVSGTTITRGATTTITNNTTQQFVIGVGKATSSKFIISYELGGAGGTKTMVACTVSGTTITAGAPTSVALTGMGQYISDDKILLMELNTSGGLPYSTANVRLYTFSSTSITQGNNFAIGTTYTNSSMKYIGNSKCIFTGTVSTNTQAFIIDAAGITPTKGTTVTVLTASTSTDCASAGSDTVCIVTGGNKYYFYTYSGTTLTLYNNVTKTNSISINQIDNIGYMDFITPGQVVTNLLYSIIGILKQSGVTTESKPVVMQGAAGGFTGLTPGAPYRLGTQYIGKVISPTEIYLTIPHSTL